MNATSGEIKAAYRRLAKIYHPDRNPQYADEEKFKLIKEAYENLINPQKRARYDARRGRATTFSASTENKQRKKNYSFTEEEAKRRQYYQQQYKRTQTTTQKPSAQPAKPQNELKYILISVPLAVALLLLIIRMYEKPHEEKTEPTPSYNNMKRSEVNTPESPFKTAFKEAAVDSQSLSVLRVVNRSGYDALVFMQNDSDHTVRHHFLADHYQLLAENLKPGIYHVYYWMGKNFSYRNFLFDSLMGNFTETVNVDSLPLPVVVSGKKNDTTMVDLVNENKPDTMLLKRIFRQKK